MRFGREQSLVPKWIGITSLFVLPVPSTLAQHYVYAIQNEHAYAVVWVRGQEPYVKINGRLTLLSHVQLAVVEAPDFQDGLVTIENLNVSNSARTPLTNKKTESSPSTNECVIQVSATSNQLIERGFALIEIAFSEKHHGYVIEELPTLFPGEKTPIRLSFITSKSVPETNCTLRIFNDLGEWKHDQLSLYELMLPKRNPPAFSADQKPEPISPNPPTYPDSVAETHPQGGSATIQCALEATGKIAEAYVQETSDPILGKYALEAVIQWHFRPLIVGGQPKPVRLSIPFHFQPHIKQTPVDSVKPAPKS